MYSPSRKVRASVRRTLWLIIIGFFSGLLIVETILEFGIETKYSPTKSVGIMLNRSQMILSKEILLEPTLFPCKPKLNTTSSPMYPLYIIVKTRAISSGSYFQRRMFTRKSWGREARSLGIPVIYAVGRASDDHTQKMLENEHKHYGDLLQFNYIDAYYNISIKSVGVLNWFVKRGCQHITPYLLYVHDDILLNPESLLKMISNRRFNLNTIYGLYLTDIEPHPSGKWAVSLEDYPNRTYPSFITGATTFYPTLILNKLIERIFYLIEENKQIFFLDDVFITGITAEQLGIQRAPLPGIEECSYTDLVSRVIIGECNNVRRLYVWAKYVLSRIGQDTYDIDRLIDRTTFIKWRGDFKHMRNGTAIAQSADKFDRSILIILAGYNPKFTFIVVFIIILFVFISIFIPQFISRRQSKQKLPLPSLITIESNSLRLLAPAK